jgi:hypothetical protein
MAAMRTEAEEAATTMRLEHARKDRFAKWLDEPMVKAMVSMIPEGQNPDHVRLVLEQAFRAGYDAGGGAYMLEMVRGIAGKHGAP